VLLNSKSFLDTAVPLEARRFSIATKVKSGAETPALASENDNANVTRTTD
jgi:hypothetical protein